MHIAFSVHEQYAVIKHILKNALVHLFVLNRNAADEIVLRLIGFIFLFGNGGEE